MTFSLHSASISRILEPSSQDLISSIYYSTVEIFLALLAQSRLDCMPFQFFKSAIIYLKNDIYAFTWEFGPVFCALYNKSFELLIKIVGASKK